MKLKADFNPSRRATAIEAVLALLSPVSVLLCWEWELIGAFPIQRLPLALQCSGHFHSLCEPVGSAVLGTRGVKTGRGSLSSGCWIVVVVGAGPGPEKYF